MDSHARLLMVGTMMAVVSGPALAGHGDPWMAPRIAYMKGVDGTDNGKIIFSATTTGVLLTVNLSGLPPGTHAINIYDQDVCGPDREEAGVHFSPEGRAHGFLMNGGPHAGDLPNIHVPQSGDLILQMFNQRISLEAGARNTLLDEDGSSVLIHSEPDDYITQPSGGVHQRLSCGVIE